MSDYLPRTKAEYLNFVKVHEPVWDANAPQLGLTSLQLDAWKALNITCETDFYAAESARTASRSATITSDQSYRAARTMAAEFIRLIKNKATTTNNPNIYALADLPAPVPPSSLPPPGAPTDLRAILNEDGTLTIKWKKNNQKGVNSVAYMVSRRVGTSGPMTIVGVTGGTTFVDDECPTPPQSNPVIQYTVQGHRNGDEGPASAVFSVFMGIGAGGGAVILSTSSGEGEGEGLKMAA